MIGEKVRESHHEKSDFVSFLEAAAQARGRVILGVAEEPAHKSVVVSGSSLLPPVPALLRLSGVWKYFDCLLEHLCLINRFLFPSLFAIWPCSRGSHRAGLGSRAGRAALQGMLQLWDQGLLRQ